MKWQLHEWQDLRTGASWKLGTVRKTWAVESPRFVILAIQTDKNVTVKRDCTLLNPININQVHLSLNSEYSPNEILIHDFSKNGFMQAHINYPDFYNSYAGERQPPLQDYAAFTTHCSFVIDCLRRKDSMKSIIIEIKLDVGAREEIVRYLS